MPCENNNDLELKCGDGQFDLFKKILGRLKQLVGLSGGGVSGNVTLTVSDIEIGAVELKDSDSDNRVRVMDSCPGAGEFGVVVRSVPCGVQPVSGPLTDAELRASPVPVSGTVSVNEPVSVDDNGGSLTVDGAVAVTNGAGAGAVNIQDGGNSITVDVPSLPLPTGAATETTLSALLDSVQGADPYFQASFFGTVDARVAKVFNIPGRRAGFNSSATLQDVGEFLGTTINLFPELTGVESLEVVSSSASDTAAGIGTRTVKVTYIDTSDNLVQSAPIVMNGVTPVALGFSANAILWMHAITGGSSETTVGNIILRIAGGGATQEQISAGENRSLSCRFRVPIGFTAYINYWQVTSVGGGTQDARLRATVDAFDRSLTTRYAAQDNCFTVTSPAENEMPWLKFPALSRIKGSTLPSATAVANRIDLNFSLLLVQD